MLKLLPGGGNRSAFGDFSPCGVQPVQHHEGFPGATHRNQHPGEQAEFRQWESFKTKKEAQERKITVEKELPDGTFLVPDTMTVEELLYKWIPIQSTKHK